MKMKTIKGAFHLHSNFSYDGSVDIKKIKEIYQKAGYSFLVMTEHRETFNNKRWLNYSNLLGRISTSDFIFVTGIEFNVGKGTHVILLGNLANIELTSIDQVRKSAADPGIIAIVAHASTIGSKYDLSWLNGVEIFNSRYNKFGVPPAKSINLFKTWRKKNKELWTIFGTDFHKESDFRRNSIYMNVPEISENVILDRIAKGAFDNGLRIGVGTKIKFQIKQKAQLVPSFELLYFLIRFFKKYQSLLFTKLKK